MREHLERVAVVLDEVMAETAATGVLTPWEHVDWLRLHADLLDRLGAAAGDGSGVSGRGELVRDRAERLADRLNRLPSTDHDRRPATDPGQYPSTDPGRLPPDHLAVSGDLGAFRAEPAADH
ncbi:hypothetical protein AB0I60_31000 [Actinosynnema sp. NPDC050436]|uniref:hypothetical protein n=1 Tax=Actinosynnema sp. NPDC050436 TaxID=3155659 RepID=UPI0033FB8610